MNLLLRYFESCVDPIPFFHSNSEDVSDNSVADQDGVGEGGRDEAEHSHRPRVKPLLANQSNQCTSQGPSLLKSTTLLCSRLIPTYKDLNARVIRVGPKVTSFPILNQPGEQRSWCSIESRMWRRALQYVVNAALIRV